MLTFSVKFCVNLLKKKKSNSNFFKVIEMDFVYLFKSR